jgi:uncharacterized protein (TIGR02246 family)
VDISSENQVRGLYQGFLDAWNEHDANKMAALLTENGSVVGFDGSMMNGRDEVASVIGAIFKDHVTAAYIGIVREVRMLTDDAALLRAVVGMVPQIAGPPGASDINPATNAIQSMVAVKAPDGWRIALMQTTPAAFHGRPEASEALTEELRAALREGSTNR